MRKILLPLLLLTGMAQASVTLTISVSAIDPTPHSGSYVRADLQNCIMPTIVNSSAIVTTPQKFYFPTGSTQVTATLQDNVTQIACSGNQLSYWTFTYVYGTSQTTIKSAELPAGNFNLSNLANLTVPPWNPGIIQGPQGVPGSGPPYYGLWLVGTVYSLGDVVSYNNNTYISMGDGNVGNTPNTSPSFWSLYVQPGAVQISPSLSQTISQPSSTFLNINYPLVFGSAPTWPFGRTVDTPDTYLTSPSVGTVTLGTSVGGSNGTLKTGTINAVSGYQLNGAAPLGHVLMGNGTSYIDSSLPLTGYTNVQNNGTGIAQQSTMNFLAPIVVTNNAGNNSTDVSLSTTGSESKLVTAGASSPSGYVATWNASGGISGTPNTLQAARVCNSNGCYRVSGDGTIEQWGTTYCSSNTCAVTFPTSFTTTTNLSVTDTFSENREANVTADIKVVSLTGFTVGNNGVVNVGGSGSSYTGGGTNHWRAIGY